MNPHPLQPLWTEKAKAAMRGKAYRGVLPGCAPLGYMNAVVNGEAVIVPDPMTCHKVRNLFLLARMRKLSLRGMLPLVAAMGLTSRNGKPIGVSSLHAVLTNPFYMGTVRYSEELIAAEHQPLIDKRLFETVQSKIRKKSKDMGSVEKPWI